MFKSVIYVLNLVSLLANYYAKVSTMLAMCGLTGFTLIREHDEELPNMQVILAKFLSRK